MISCIRPCGSGRSRAAGRSGTSSRRRWRAGSRIGEDAEDISASVEALAEHGEAGGVEADRYFQRLVADGRVEYETG